MRSGGGGEALEDDVDDAVDGLVGDITEEEQSLGEILFTDH